MIQLRSPLGIALALALAGPTLSGQSTGGSPPNLLVDGSFESEGSPAWFAESWRRTFRDDATDPGNARDGKRSAVIRIEGPADDAMLVQLVSVKPATRWPAGRSVRACPGASEWPGPREAGGRD